MSAIGGMLSPAFFSFQDISLTSQRKQKLCVAFSPSLPFSLEGKRNHISALLFAGINPAA